MKSKATMTIGKLFTPALRTLRKSLSNLPRENFRKVAHSDLPKSGIYLIYDENGVLLYVGYSGKDLKGRIRSHVGSCDPLMLWLVSNLNTVVTKRVHRCACGIEQKCSSGETVTEGFEEAYEKMKAQMYDSFSVSVLDHSENGFGIYGRDFEKFVQWMLLPHYGSWHHPTLGQENISETSWNHPSIDNVIAALEENRPVIDVMVGKIEKAAEFDRAEFGVEE